MDETADLKAIHLPEMIDAPLFEGIPRGLMEKD